MAASGDDRADPEDGEGQPSLGVRADPRRTPEAGNSCQQLYDVLFRPIFTFFIVKPGWRSLGESQRWEADSDAPPGWAPS